MFLEFPVSQQAPDLSNTLRALPESFSSPRSGIARDIRSCGVTVPARRANSRTTDAARARTYILGPENHLVPVILDDFLRAEARLSPVVVYGPLGAGKTHLAELLTACVNAQAADSAVIIKATDLLGKSRDPHPWSRLRQAEVIVFLNVDDLARKPNWQRQLTTLLDEWLAHGRRVLFTSRVHPGEIEGLNPRLAARLSSGLCVGLEEPRLETRVALLQHWASAARLTLAPEALEELARRTEGPPARLHGVLWQLALAQQSRPNPETRHPTRREITAHDITVQDITVQDVAQFLARGSAVRKTLRVSLIARSTARRFSVTLADLRGTSRRRTVARARSVAMYLARTLAGKPLAEIGRWFSDRDHTTVLHSCRKIEQERQQDAALDQALKELTDLLQSGLE